MKTFFEIRKPLFTAVSGGAAIITLASVPLFAQTPPDAGSLLRDQEQLQRDLPAQLPADEVTGIRPELKAPKGLAFTLKSVRFAGGEGVADEAELQGVVQGAIGRELDYPGAQALAEAVTRFLRQKGFILARAYLPEQDVTEGHLEIAIVQGRLDQSSGQPVEVRGKGLRIPEARLRKIVHTNLGTGESVSREKLERAVLLVNDLPGISARTVLEPGREPGTTRLALEVEEDKIFSSHAGFDNFGSRYNGEARGSAGLSLNDPFGLGDQISVMLSASEDKVTGIAGYQVPLGSRGMRLSLSASTLDYEVGKELSSANLEGDAFTFSSRLSYPLVRTRVKTVSLSGGYEWKKLEDDANGSNSRDRRVDNYSLGLAGRYLDKFGGGGLSTWSATAIFGELDLSRNAADLAADQATARSDGSFERYVYSLGRLQRLPGSFSIYGGLVGQFASKNLGSSEEFSLGGPSGVRAYPVSEASGDEGWLAKLELRYDVPQQIPFGKLQLMAFADTGRIRLHEDPYPGAVTNATGKNSYQLSGAGLGLHFYENDRFSLRGSWAVPIDDNPGRSGTTGMDADGKDRNSRFWLQGTWMF